MGAGSAGAAGIGARLRQNATICTRLDELRKAVTATLVQLAITERAERLVALQDRWDRVRTAIEARSREDYAAMMKTGVVCRKKRWIGGKDGYEVTEYEIDSAVIEALNSIERRAAIETGQEVDRQDINLGTNTKLAQKAEILAKAFSVQELEQMRDRMQAVIAAEERGQVIDAPLDEKEESKQPASFSSEARMKPESAPPASTRPPSSATPSQQDTSAAKDAVVPSVPKAPKSWRD